MMLLTFLVQPESKVNNLSIRQWQLSLYRHYKSCGKSHGKERLKGKALPWDDLRKQTQKKGADVSDILGQTIHYTLASNAVDNVGTIHETHNPISVYASF